VGSFSLTFVEIFLGIGIISFITLLFLLGLKYMAVLPEKTEEEKATAKLKKAPPEAAAPAEAAAQAEAEPQAEPDAGGSEPAEAPPEDSEQAEATVPTEETSEESDKPAEGG